MELMMKVRVYLVLILLFTSDLAARWEPDRARNGMVVSQKALASEIGLQVLKDGGNSIDAAVATAFALAVTLPRAGNIGGGGFLMYRSAEGEVEAYDFRETAPAAAFPDMFLSNGEYDFDRHQYSGRSIGVPGTVAGLHLAWQEHGSLPWKRLVEPAIELARDGIVVSDDMERSLNKLLSRWKKHPASFEKYTREGELYRMGETFIQPLLAETLQGIAEKGPNAFYEGKTAELIVAEVGRAGGFMTLDDLRKYKVKKRQPIRGTYRGFDIYSMPPPSSGGVTLVAMLNILEGFDISKAGLQSAQTLHLMAESMRRAFADRAQYLGDPDFNPNIPIKELTSKVYASKLRQDIDPVRASESSAKFHERNSQSRDTTHFSVVDKQRNAVSMTYTIEEPMMVVSGAGFLLNSELGDFNGAPGVTRENGLIGTDPNIAEPGKRPLSSMTPTIVARNGSLFMVTGSPGDRTIINTVLQTIVNAVDFNLNAQESVSLGRIHHQWLPDQIVYQQNGFSTDVLSLLQKMGHKLKPTPILGLANIIIQRVDEGVLEGGTDLGYRDGRASGY